MKKITNILFLLIGFNSIAQQTLPLNKLERGTNGQIPMCAPSGTINGVLQMYTPTLTVINGTISGSPINGTLTIPTQSTTITGSTNVTVSGSAPNYTISSTPTLAISGQSLSISGGNTITIPTGTLTTSYIGYGDGSNNITGSSSLTYSNSILKINPSVVSTETRSAMPLQIGGDFITIGSSASANVTPTFIEFLKSNGAGGFRACRGTVGFLGSDEMNLSVNMDYTDGYHRYYDVTKNAIWSFLGNNATGNMGYQWVPANNPNTSDIWTTYGCVPFRVDNILQPLTGKGINGFSKVTTGQIQLTDITNTATVTATAYTVNLDGGILKHTGLAGMDKRLTNNQGDITYNSNTSTGTDLNLMTPFSINSGGTGVNVLSYSTTVGYKVGVQGLAEDGNVNVGLLGKAVKSKANATNVGLVGVASNTNATNPNQIGGYFGLTGVPDATISAVSGGIVVDNGTSTSNIAVFRDNGTNVITVADGGALTSTQNIASSSKTAGIGYAVGSGSTVTQATSRTTGVTINSITGSITLVSAAGSATWQTFTVTNSAVTAKDVIIVNKQSGTDLNLISVTNVAAGSFKISFATTGGTTTEQPIFNFAVIKGQTN